MRLKMTSIDINMISENGKKYENGVSSSIFPHGKSFCYHFIQKEAVSSVQSQGSRLKPLERTRPKMFMVKVGRPLHDTSQSDGNGDVLTQTCMVTTTL